MNTTLLRVISYLASDCPEREDEGDLALLQIALEALVCYCDEGTINDLDFIVRTPRGEV